MYLWASNCDSNSKQKMDPACPLSNPQPQATAPSQTDSSGSAAATANSTAVDNYFIFAAPTSKQWLKHWRYQFGSLSLSLYSLDYYLNSPSN